MPQFTVRMTQVIDISVKVEAEDYEAAIEASFESGPGGICAQCSGWGHAWSRDDMGERVVESVDDESGTEVYSEHEHWTRVRDGQS